MADFDFDAITPLLKQTFDNPVDLYFKSRPLLGMIRKSEGKWGEYKNQPVNYGPGSGISATFSDAQDDSAAADYTRFRLTDVSNYAVYNVTGKAIDAAQGESGLMDAFTAALNPKWEGLANLIASSLYRDGNGVAGQDDGWTSGDEITLADPADAANFYKGAKIKSSATASGAVKTGELTVESVDRSSGTVTFTADCDSGIATFAQDDYLFIAGNAYNNASYKMVHGLSAWASAGASVFGVDQTADSFLACQAPDFSSLSTVEECLIKSCSRAAEMGGEISDIFIHPRQYEKLTIELSSKNQYNKMDAKVKARDGKGKQVASIGYTGIVLDTPAGRANVWRDIWATSTRAFCLELDSWTLHSRGKLIDFAVYGGANKNIMVYNADAVQGRLRARIQLGTNAPAHNVIATLPSL